MKLEILVRIYTNNCDTSNWTQMEPIEKLEIASKTKISKKNIELLFSIIEKILKSNKLRKISKSLDMLIYLIDNGGEFFK